MDSHATEQASGRTTPPPTIPMPTQGEQVYSSHASLSSSFHAAARSPMPTTPRKRTIDYMVSPSRTTMTSPNKHASAYAMRSPMRNRQMPSAFVHDDDDEPEDTFSNVLSNEILDASPTKRGRLLATPAILPRHQNTAPSPNDSKFTRSLLSAASRSALVSTQKGTWEIPQSPYKILDAPDLQDDYYLNLIDWSFTDILGVGLGSCVYLWSAASSKVTKLCDLGANDTITSVAWMQKGTHLAIGTDTGLVQLWDIEKEKKVREFEGHTKRVGTLSWNGETLSSGSRDKSIHHRDARIKRGGHVSKSERHAAEVCGLKWDYEGGQLASGGNDNALLIWDKRDLTTPVWAPEHPHSAAVKALTWSPHKPNVIASGGGTADRKIKIWNIQSQTLTHQHDTNSQVCNLAWGKQTEHLISTHGYSRNHITVWKTQSHTLKEAATLTGHVSRVVYLAMSPDGQSIVTGAGDETLRFWKICNSRRGRVGGLDTRTCII
ncbi:WD40-repeat-containing domain protein [Fimicolochytrium jonesii]|uniref:WD40-repeat-containing domain protein n=1 Tax=Fimicolochytrium jonesii TaxID=1396493 RepID=UPI0022FEEEB9|nr:WD40-repeat-containing domain protein [Fimicolochytrium jonesii]KAI8817715.1 WD40-repeat-containing domain protein [Fimicolochytrium jonesii]